MRAATVLIALSLAAVGSAAQPASPATAPSCEAELSWILDYAERNYSGFEYKVPAARRPQYDALVAELRAEAIRAGDAASCDALLARWTAFFGDGHLSISRRSSGAATSEADGTPAAIRARYADAPRRDITESEARARLEALGTRRAPIEGIWEMQGGNYRGVILRDDEAGTSYAMSILRADSVWWMPGQVKAVFTPTGDAVYATEFRMRDHSEQRWEARVRANVMTMNNGSPWLRDWPREPGDLSAEDLARTGNAAFRVREAGVGTLVLHIPSFNDPRAMDSLWAADSDRVKAAERLVIDLRGNGGGSDHNFRMLLPLVYTQPIRMVSNALLATPDNIAVNEALAADTALPQAIRNGILASVRRMREANGRWYEYDDYVVDGFEALPLPRRVDVLVDRGCASSCEQFLLAARQSRKVTIYGTRSAGILDFGNVRQARMPGGTLQLNYPTTRSKRLPHSPVDGVGIPPDVAVPDTAIDQVGWVLRQAGR